MMICIKNAGELDMKALFLLGASTKRGDNTKIGLFGSGNKYAMATLLRKNIPFRIYSGERQVEITKMPETFRDKEFEVIYIDGEKTSLTTEMGPDWETWFCLREFISNAMDEGEHHIYTTEEYDPVPGETKIYIEETEEVKEILDNIKKYFCFNEEPLETIDTGYNKISVYEHDSDDLVFYRKGIRCNPENEDKAYFRYNFNEIEINESRVIKYTWKACENIARYLMLTQREEVIKKYISSFSDYKDFEKADFNVSSKPSEKWAEIIGDRRMLPESLSKVMSLPAEDRHRAVILPDALVVKLKDTYPDLLSYGDKTMKYVYQDVTEDQQSFIDESLLNLWEMNIPITDDIKTVKFKEGNIMGAYIDGDIFISVDFLKDQKQVELILLEEYIHSLGYSHGTRQYDDFLIECVHSLLRSEKPEKLIPAEVG